MRTALLSTTTTDSDVKSFFQKPIVTRPLSAPSGRRREAGGGEQRAVVTQLLGYMRKWLLFPSFSLLHIFHRHRVEQDFLLYEGNEWSAQGSNSTACPGWDLPHTVWACPGDAQSPPVVCAPKAGPPSWHWTQGGRVHASSQPRKEANVRAVLPSSTSSAASVQHLVAGEGFSALEVPPLAGLVLECESEHASSSM